MHKTEMEISIPCTIGVFGGENSVRKTNADRPKLPLVSCEIDGVD